MVTCCHWHPPQVPNRGHGAATRSGPGRSIATSSPHASLPFSRSIRARTRSPGAASGTNVTRPSSAARAPSPPRCRPTASPPGASDSTSTGTSFKNAIATTELRERLRPLPALQIEIEVAVERAADRRCGRWIDHHLDRGEHAIVAQHDVEVRAQALAEVHLEVLFDLGATIRREVVLFGAA